MMDKSKIPPEKVLVMTPGKRGAGGEEDVIRIERVLTSRVDTSQAQYSANGPFTGIVINKAGKDLPEVKRPNIEMDFTAFVVNKDKSAKTKQPNQEQRLLRFWFPTKSASRRTQTEYTQNYFKHLIKPERFPTDYVHFIKKAVLLTRHFQHFTRVELVMRPRADSSDAGSSDDEEEDILQQARLRRERTLQNMNKWAKVHEDLSDDDNFDVSDEALDNYITLLTPAKYEYMFLPYIIVNIKPFLTFRIRAKSDCHVALSALYGDTQSRTYEIVIGGWNNTKSVIRDGSEGPIMEEVLTPNILSPTVLRSFWIRWGRRILEVGEGNQAGERVFLRCFIPNKNLYHINSMAVTTGPRSPGEWELVEKLIPESETAKSERKSRWDKLRAGLLLEAKRRQFIELLGSAYPSQIRTSVLLRMTKTQKKDAVKVVNKLRSLANAGYIIEARTGMWTMMHTSRHIKGAAKLVHIWPTINHRDTPTLAIVTTRMCEKMAVDVSMDSRITYVKSDDKGEFGAVTIGRIDGRVAVHVKISQPMDAHSNQVLAGILGHFRNIEQGYLVGVGGAVPHFSDYEKHVRLGDVVVSLPSRDRRPVYVHCDKVGPRKFGRYQYGIDVCWMTDDLLQGHVVKAKDLGEGRNSNFKSAFDRLLEKAYRTLCNAPIDFRRPSPKLDKLFGYVDGEYVPIQHPRPPKWMESLSPSKPSSNFRLGPIGSGKHVAKNDILRMDFAQQYELAAFDTGCKDTIDTLQKSGIEQYLVIRGIADYVDGSINKRWQPHAALCAASFMKTFLTILPKDKY